MYMLFGNKYNYSQGERIVLNSNTEQGSKWKDEWGEKPLE